MTTQNKNDGLFKENKSYKIMIEKYRFWRDLYKGGDYIIKKPYLQRHPFESDAQWKIRKARAVYRNACGPIVKVFNSAIWRKKPERELDTEAMNYFDNVDLYQNNADLFFSWVSKRALYQGISFVLVNATRSTKPLNTQKDYKDEGIRPFFTIISCENLIDWGDENGTLTYICIKDLMVLESKPFQKQESFPILRYWDTKKWAVLKNIENGDIAFIDQDGNKTNYGIVKDEHGNLMEGDHNLGIVPIVPFYFEREVEMVGSSVLSDIDMLALKMYWKLSELDKAEFDCAVPLLFGSGLTEDEYKGFIKATSNGLFPGNPEAKLGYIEPGNVSFETIRTTIKETETAIKEIALRMTRPDTAVGETYEAKKMDKQQLITQLAEFSLRCSEKEKRCWDIFNLWLNKSSKNTIQYNQDFDPNEISSELINALDGLNRSNILSKETIRYILRQGEIPFPEGWTPEEEEEKVKAEQKENSDMALDWRNDSIVGKEEDNEIQETQEI